MTKLLGNDTVQSDTTRYKPKILEHFELAVTPSAWNLRCNSNWRRTKNKRSRYRAMD